MYDVDLFTPLEMEDILLKAKAVVNRLSEYSSFQEKIPNLSLCSDVLRSAAALLDDFVLSENTLSDIDQFPDSAE